MESLRKPEKGLKIEEGEEKMAVWVKNEAKMRQELCLSRPGLFSFFKALELL